MGPSGLSNCFFKRQEIALGIQVARDILEAHVGSHTEAHRDPGDAVDSYDFDRVDYTRFGRREKRLAGKKKFPTHTRSKPGGGFFRFYPLPEYLRRNIEEPKT